MDADVIAVSNNLEGVDLENSTRIEKYKKEELYRMDAVDVYKLVLSGRIRKFPNGFWKQPEALQNGIKCTKFLIEEILGFSEENIKSQVSIKTFINNKLRGMLQICFCGSPYRAINAAYPGKFRPWEVAVPNKYWEDIENGIEAVRWLIEEELKWSDDDIREKLSQQIFIDNRLGGSLLQCFDGSPYMAINSAYPGRFKPWEIAAPNNYWDNIENGIEAVRWLIEKKLKWSDDDIRENINLKLFRDNGLCGLLSTVFNNSPYNAINTAYPGRFKPWEFKCTPSNYWDSIENAIEAIHWLIEKKLKWSDDDIREKLSHQIFIDNNLGGMMSCCFQKSPYDAINTAYPGRFKPWEIAVPNKYWKNTKNGIEAVYWLIEEKLKWSDDDIRRKLSHQVFRDNGLVGMLGHCFRNSPYQAINTAYPGRFKPWELRQTPISYWDNIENGIDALRWLIEDKLGLSEEEIKEQISGQFFADNGLRGMLATLFNNSPYEALNAVYPGRFKPWELKSTPSNYWDNIENGIEATRWLIEEKLRLSEEEIKEQISTQIFIDNGLRGMLATLFNGSPYQAINAAYPNKFRPWELGMTPLNYWSNIENGIEATHWLIEEKLGLSEGEIKEQISTQIFIDNGLRGMLFRCFNGSIYKALSAAYPNKFDLSDKNKQQCVE